MKKSLLAMAAAPLLWLISGAEVVAQVKGESAIPTQQQLGRLGLERAWWAQAVINPHRDKVRNVVVDEDIVYVQASSGVTTAFDLETGRQLWAVLIGQFDPSSYPMVSNEELAMTVVGSSTYALEKRTGKVLWTLSLPGVPSAGPAVDDHQLYVGTLDGSVYAYDLKRIRKLQEERKLPAWSSDAQRWRYKAGKEITSPPIATGRVVNFASADGSLYSVSALNRKLVYQLETNKAIIAPLAQMDRTMYMASEDNSFYALNLFTGQVEWEFTSPLPIRKTIWAVDQGLYLLPDRGGIYSLNPATGIRRWSHVNLLNFIAVLRGTLAASDVDGNLVLVGTEKGEIIGTLPIRRFTMKTGNDRVDRIILATEGGLVVCLRKTDALDPIFHRHPDRMPLIPEFEPDSPEDSTTTESSPLEQ